MTKQNGIFLIVIILLIIILCVIICTKKKESKVLEFQNMEEFQYLKDNKENIESVSIRKQIEGDRKVYNVDINKAFDIINNIKIKGKSNISITDNSLAYIFKFKDSTEISFSFEGKYFHYMNENYEIEGYKTIDIGEF